MGTVALKSSWTLPPAGIVKLSQDGVVAPTAALVVVGRVAPPANTIVGAAEAFVNGDGAPGSTSETATLDAVSTAAAFAMVMR